MDDRSLHMLELDAIRTRLADATAFAGGRALAEAVLPSPDPAVVARRQAETDEAVALLEQGGAPRLAGAHDVREPVARAARGASLVPEPLAAIADTVRTGLDVRGTLLEREEAAPLLAARAGAIEPSLEGLLARLDAAIEPDGSGVRDGASPALRRVRKELVDARTRAADRLRALAQSAELRPDLQEDFVTERGGRPVIAVKASSRSKVPGIVHDASGSGQTLFVEPFAVVELHNRIRELAGAEREEVERILAELSQAVAGWAAQLEACVRALAAIDLAMACGEVSQRQGGCRVEAAQDVLLVEARHPLLDPRTAVPIDLDLRGVRGVIVSGANTGGKTVALKTLGLAALQYQSGLRPPAKRAQLPVFDAVLADIGDEQSIAQSLSTFSGHLRNLRAILDAATSRSLVLLDEVAAGTDPVEGAALAQALVERLIEAGALTLVTTHFAELKQWAGATEGVVNAAVGFDPETLAPTYTVSLGRPGASHALQIAERLGLDRAVVAAAREAIAPERHQLEQLLAEATQAEREAARRQHEAEAEAAEAQRLREEASRREQELGAAVADVRAGAEAARETARREAEAELAALRRELEELRAEIRSARREEGVRRRATASAADRAERERDRRLESASTRARRAQAELVRSERPIRQTAPLAVGDPVVSPTLGVRGTIVEISGDTAEVHGGGMRIHVPLARLAPDASGRQLREPPPVVVRATAPAGIESEIDVRGRRADEAREAARHFVDAAHLAGKREVRIVHGRGTGAVRAAVRDEVGSHPLVDGWESESADGATLVKLAVGGS
jgi:DNA mismatch repair protein MutS2